jgi:hypothetical protein
MSRGHQYFQILTALTLAVLIALTSTATAMSQLRGAAVGEMVICTGHGMRTVLMDAQGQPVDAKVQCPECLLSNVDLPEVASGLAVFVDVVLAVDVDTAPVLSDAAQRPAVPPARGPPAA